jgi:hypothetical protein
MHYCFLVGISPQGRYVLLAQDRMAGIIDAVTGTMVKTVPIPEMATAVDFTPDGKSGIVHGKKGPMIIDLPTGQLRTESARRGRGRGNALPGKLGSPATMAVSPNGKLAIVFGRKGSTLIDVATRQEIKSFAGAPFGAFLTDRTALLGTGDRSRGAGHNADVLVLDVNSKEIAAGRLHVRCEEGFVYGRNPLLAVAAGFPGNRDPAEIRVI